MWIFIIWVIGAYVLISIYRPKENEEIVDFLFWPITFTIVYGAKFSNLIFKKYWYYKINKEDYNDNRSNKGNI